MKDLQVIDEPAAVVAILDPLRSRILQLLAVPGSATTVAATTGTTRQKVNYHLHQLEALGLVELIEERPRRGLTERVLLASATSFVVSPATLGQRAPDPDRFDRLSASYLIAVAARMVREVGDLVARAHATHRTLPTLAIDTEIKFATAADRAAFTGELATAITGIVARYHDEAAPTGRWHRLVVGAHPIPASAHRPTKES